MFGLSLGITACLLLGLYVNYESNYDSFHKNGDQIYRITQPDIWDDWTTQMANLGPNVATALKEDIPELEAVTRVMSGGSQTTKVTHENGCKVGICGQAPSDHPEFAAFLVECGIDTISLNPDSVIQGSRYIADAEAKLGR